MNVVYTIKAGGDLDAIWRWNCNKYGVAHADDYRSFLAGLIDGLVTTHGLGRVVPSESTLRYAYLRRHQGGHAHLAVYAVDSQTVTVYHVFHSAQDWQRSITP